MKNRVASGHDLYFVIQEEHRAQDAKQATITIDVIERMIRNCQFKMSQISVELSNKLGTTEILLSLGLRRLYPISRFPRSLFQDEETKESKCCKC